VALDATPYDAAEPGALGVRTYVGYEHLVGRFSVLLDTGYVVARTWNDPGFAAFLRALRPELSAQRPHVHDADPRNGRQKGRRASLSAPATGLLSLLTY
jgi:hypothetical protein